MISAKYVGFFVLFRNNNFPFQHTLKCVSSNYIENVHVTQLLDVQDLYGILI